MINIKTKMPDYTCRYITPITRLIFLARRIILVLPDIIKENDKLTATSIHSILKEAKPREATLQNIDFEDVAINSKANEELLHNLVDNMNYAIHHQTEFKSATILDKVITEMIDCSRRLLTLTIELFVEHIGAIESTGMSIPELKQKDYWIDYYADHIDHIYTIYQPLEVVFSKLYWTFVLDTNDKFRPLYVSLQKIYWMIVDMDTSLASTKTKLDEGVNMLYFKDKYYDRDKSANWNVGLGCVKPTQVITSTEFDAYIDEYDFSRYEYDDY